MSSDLVNIVPAGAGFFLAVPVHGRGDSTVCASIHQLPIIAWRICSMRNESTGQHVATVDAITIEGDADCYQDWAIVNPSGVCTTKAGVSCQIEDLFDEFGRSDRAIKLG